MNDKTELVRLRLEVRYPRFWFLTAGERTLLALAYLCDDIRVREVGRNAGEWVCALLKSAGVPVGSPWCAAAIQFACTVSRAPCPASAAAVSQWRNWARSTGRHRTSAKRGHLAYWLNSNGTGHIGIVVGSAFGMVRTIEGNTSSGEAGSQRDGDGLYRRVRRASRWDGYIEL
jgi:hypothetical protein